MNIDIFNIAHYRVTDYGDRAGNRYQLFNRQTDNVYDITRLQFNSIKEHMSIAACSFVEAQHYKQIVV